MTKFSTSAAVDFRVVNHLGVVLHTSPDRDLAKRWAKANAYRHEGLEVHEITITTQSRRVYRPTPARPVNMEGPALARAFA